MATPVVLMAVLAGCSGPLELAADPSPTVTPASTLVGDDAVEAAATAGDGLPGEAVEGPATGATLMVAGVPAGDLLDVHDVPGIGGAVFGGLDAQERNVTATGRARRVGDTVWYEIEGGAVDDGWVNGRFLVYEGPTSDVTAALNGLPAAAPLPDLAVEVARLRTGAPTESGAPRVVVSGGPRSGDLGEVVVDIVGAVDDDVVGERLRLFARPLDGGQRYTLRTVERTLLCAHGADDTGCA